MLLRGYDIRVEFGRVERVSVGDKEECHVPLGTDKVGPNSSAGIEDLLCCSPPLESSMAP